MKIKSNNIDSHKDVLWGGNYLKVWIANFLIYFSFLLLTPLFPLYLSETFNAGKDMIGLVLSGYTITALFVRPFSGYVVDSFNRKKVLLLCYAVFAVAFVFYPIASSLMLFALVRTFHGAAFGAVTVANTTVAIDVLPSSRRAEGIGYYGLSNNIATAIGPSIALLIYGAYHNFNILFVLAIIVAFSGVLLNSTLKLNPRPLAVNKSKLSLDRFILLKGWSQGLTVMCYSFAYGVLTTYIAIYGKEELGITTGTGLFFTLFAIGLIISRLTGSKSLREGKIVHNATTGSIVAMVGYIIFSLFHSQWAFYSAAFIIGLGNGHMYPAMQTMFLDLATHDQRGTANSTILVSWDLGVGLGMLLGGYIAETLGFHSAFWVATAIDAVGVMFLLLYAGKHFQRNKLR